MNPKELPIPKHLARKQEATEIARLWLVDGDHVVFIVNGEVWDDPIAWGITLYDLARHAARARAAFTGQSIDAQSTDGVLERILEGFDAERAAPTADPM